ncbi:MAG: metal-dependent transcriptional regulator [Planctomycetota bacterium]|jgi:DtxR family Mn-dependent transcriptional regulator
MALLDPALGLLLAFCATGALYLLLRPGRGYYWRWTTLRRSHRRVIVEDALKHLYDCEYKRRGATLESLAGSLSITPGRAAELLAHLEGLGLARSTETGLALTDTGRSDALRVIRIHRLWEQYFAEETGLSETAWHEEADRREHTLEPDEVERLAARLGHPRYDPHGDPIPTSDGEIPPSRGQPLSTLPVGAAAVIVHVEDEPDAVYAQLVAENMVPGLRIRVLESDPKRVRFQSAGEEHVLAPVFAANLTVVPLPDEAEPEPEEVRLSSLRPGERATVTGILPACRGMQLRRLLDLGFVPGTAVEAELESPNGDPIAYRIRGTLIALRREQADLVGIVGVAAS